VQFSGYRASSARFRPRALPLTVLPGVDLRLPRVLVFGRGSKAPAVEEAKKVIDDLHRKIGQLQVECDFLAGQPAISRVLRGGR
jgi:hypothetical protein